MTAKAGRFEHKFTTYEEAERRGCPHCNNSLGYSCYRIENLPDGKVRWGHLQYCKVAVCKPDFSGRCRVCKSRLFAPFEKSSGICWICEEEQEKKEAGLEQRQALKNLERAVSKLESLDRYEGKELLEKMRQYSFVFRAMRKEKGEVVITLFHELPRVIKRYLRKKWFLYRARCDRKFCDEFKTCVACVVEQVLRRIEHGAKLDEDEQGRVTLPKLNEEVWAFKARLLEAPSR